MLIVFTGNGKGKTSAALGSALRSSGWGRKVCVIQFIKGNKEVGEWKAIKEILNTEYSIFNIQLFQFFDDKKLSITKKSILDNPEYKESCEKAWEFAKENILNKKFDLIILDEICNALHLNLLNEQEILSFVGANCRLPDGLNLIMTGRDASEKLIEIADLVTEMNEVKHPFQKGISAKEGIDY